MTRVFPRIEIFKKNNDNLYVPQLLAHPSLHDCGFSVSMITFIALSQFKLEILRNRMKNACLLVKTWLIVPANVLTVFEASLLLMFEHTNHIFYRFSFFLLTRKLNLKWWSNFWVIFHRLGSYRNARLCTGHQLANSWQQWSHNLSLTPPHLLL